MRPALPYENFRKLKLSDYTRKCKFYKSPKSVILVGIKKETTAINLDSNRSKNCRKKGDLKKLNYKEEIMDSKGIESSNQTSSVKSTDTENKEATLSIVDNSKDSNTNSEPRNKNLNNPLGDSHMFLPDINISNSMMRKQNGTYKKDTMSSYFNDHRLRSQSAKVGDHSPEMNGPHKQQHHQPQQQVDDIKKDLLSNIRNSEASDCISRLKIDVDAETKRLAERAIKDSKIFVCNGPYQGLRLSLRRRGWVEKFHMTKENSVNIPKSALLDEDGDKVSAIRTEDGIKLAYLSSMVQYHNPTLTFTVKTSEVLNKTLKDTQIVNHYGKATAFTTKIGLSYSLRNSDLFNEEMSHSFFPRCYNLSCEDDKQAFMDDYNLTSCMAILKYYVTQHDSSTPPDKYFYNGIHNETDSSQGSKITMKPSESEAKELMSLPLLPVRAHKLLPLNPEIGSENPLKASESVPVRTQKHVSMKAIRFALDRCLEYIACFNKEDIKDDFDQIKIKWMSSKEKHWLDFQDAYRLFVTNKLKVDRKAKELLPECKKVLQLMEKHWPQFSIDGVLNVWILKPGAKSRGRGIKCSCSLNDIIDNYTSSTCITVVQKYIEKPLLIHKTKFDLRQWFLVTDWNPLTLWFYKDAYLRFCSKEFTLRDLHESIHLSNNSVQKNYLPCHERATLLPLDNMWTSDEFKDYLKSINLAHAWNDIIVPGMKKWILNVMICTQDNIEHRKEAFELFGADFMLTVDYQPWLIEINSSPSMARNTKATSYLVNRVLEDTIKVVIDRKSNPTCDTGQFELAFKQARSSQHSLFHSAASPVFVIGDRIADVIRD